MIIKFRASKLKNHMNADVFAWNARLDSTLLSSVRMVPIENQMIVNATANKIRFIFADLFLCVIQCYFISLVYLFLVMLLSGPG